MARKRISREDWEALQLERYPDWNSSSLEQITGPKRKVRFLADQNLEDDLVDAMTSRPQFRIYRAPAGTDDDVLWHEARRHKRILITADGRDFLKDQKFPLHESPGLIVLTGRTASDKADAFVRAVDYAGLVYDYRVVGPTFLAGYKVRASAQGVYYRFASYDGMVVEGSF